MLSLLAFLSLILFEILLLVSSDSSSSSSAAAAAAATAVQSDLYTAITDANTSDSLNRIKSSKLKYYEFKYDSVSGRKQLGYIGEDVHKYFPDALDIVPSHVIPSIDRSKPPTLLKNFPIVDKNIIFMHGLAALQELVTKLENIENVIDKITSDSVKINTISNDIEVRLSSEIDRNIQEREKLLESEVEAARKAAELVDIQNEREKKLIEQGLEDEKSLLDYQEELSKQRLLRSESLARESMEKALSLERELAEKKESTRLEAEANLQKARYEQEQLLLVKKTELEKAKITAEMNAKAELERANEDIAIRKLQAQAKMDTERMITGVKAVTDQIIRLIQSVLLQPERLATIVGILFGLYLAVYIIREMISLVRQTIQNSIGRPKLIRETSYNFSLIPGFLSLKFWGKESLEASLKTIEDYFVDVILSDDDRDRVTKLALATRNTKSSKASYRHVLLHGPPGTGKTMVARRLAQCSGMDYAIMSGGDVGPLGEDAVNQLHGLFKWAASSKKGLLVFIDEADAFLSSRGTSNSASNGSNEDPHSRHALNALLYQTGTESMNFMLVLATNRPEDLDSAVLDRMDVSIKIDIPSDRERESLVSLYMQEHIVNYLKNSKRRSWLHYFGILKCKESVDSDCLTNSIAMEIANKCKDFSGREISKMFIAAQYSMLLAENQILTLPLLRETVAMKIKEHNEKKGFMKKDNNHNNVALTSKKIAKRLIPPPISSQ